MSTNGQLVFTDVDKITFKGVGNTSNAVVDTVTGKIGVGIDNPDANLHVLGNSYVSTNLELGGTLIMGTVNVSAHHSLEAVTAEGNTTPLTVEFSNATTGLVTTGNVEVGNELTVTGNTTVSSNLTVSGNVVAEYLHGDGSNITGISQTLQAITDHGNVTSNTIQFSNVLTSFVTSSSIDIGGSVQIKNQNQNTLNADISVISPDTTKGAWYGASSWEVSKLTASDAAADDEFGDRSIDISGDTLVVGAFNEGGSAGAVYVFTRNTTGSGWVERVKLTTSNNSGNGNFGERVRIQDDTIVVGAPSDDSNKGAVYVFTRNTPGDLTSGWTEQYKITGSQSTAGDYFSKGLDLYGDTLIVGSYHADTGSGAYGGEVYVFTRTAGNINSSWTERARLVPTIDHVVGDRFGNHISLYQDTVAIGAYGDGGNATGSFYIFTRTTPGDLTSGWTERQKITAHDAASYDYYGWAISLYENTLMVGAMEENSDKGKVYVYSRTGSSITSSWSHVTDLTASDAFTDDRFGYDLHLEKDVAVISSPRDNHPSGGYPYGAGAIYIFERNTPGLSTSSWTQIRKIVPANGGALDYFGKAVAMDGGTIVVSAPGDDIATDTAGSGQHTNEGSAYVYTANVSGLKLNADHVSITGTHGLAVSGDVEVGTANLFVDTVNSRVGIGVTSPQTNFHVESSGSTGIDVYGGDTSHPYIFIGEQNTNYSRKWGGKFTYYGDSNVRWLNISVVDDNIETHAITVRRNGHIGINQDQPTSQLEVNGTIRAGTYMNGGNAHYAALDVRGGGTGSENQPVAIVNSYTESDTIIFCDRNPWVNYAFAHENSSNDFLITGGGSTNSVSNYNVRDFDGGQQTAYVKHRFDVDYAHLEIGGLLKAGLGNGGDLINFGTRSGQAAVYMVSANSTNDWDNYPGFYSPGEAEMRWHGDPNDLNIRSDGWVYGHGGFAPFTGVHTCNSYFGEEKIGLIVCSNGDYCTDDKRGRAWFNDIQIMNTSPLINLCTKEKDKSVFGVIGKIQNTYKKMEFIQKLDYECLPADQKELYEPLVTGYKHRKTQEEVTIEEYNALDDKKYFKPVFEQAKAINYDGTTKFQVTHVNSLGEGGIWVVNKSGNFENGDYITSSSVPGYGQKQEDDLLHNYTVAKITTDCDFTKITYTRRYIQQIDGIHQYDEHNEPIYVNDTDENGNDIQNLKFKLRYLLPDGTQISEEEYTTRALADEKVYVAAFVGCTYHCG